MKKGNFIAGFILLIIFLGTCGVSADENFDQTLTKARKLVEQKEYMQALEEYSAIQNDLRRDPGLVIEWARVYTYADKHPNAIALFEEVRKTAPEKENEILRELADQYKWNGDVKKSIEIYRLAQDKGNDDHRVLVGLAEALAWDHQYKQAIKEYNKVLQSSSDTIHAMLGKAEVLSWQDKLEEANKIYHEILKNEPQNLSAKNGLARNIVWQSYNRQGIQFYEDILEQHPDDPGALEGLAYAYHWDGQEAVAVNTLERVLTLAPERNASRDLYDEIGTLKQLHFNQFNRYSYDSNKLSIMTDTLQAGKFINESTALGSSYDRYFYRQEGQDPVAGNRGGVNVSKRLSEYVKLDSYIYATEYNIKDFTPITTNTWFTLYPTDMWRFYLSYDRETFEDITSLRTKILTNSGSFSFDFKPDRFWFFSARYKRSTYSDDNNQNTAFADIEYRLNQTPYFKLYYNFYYSDWSEQRNNGYFNPNSIQSNTAGIYASKEVNKKLFVEGQVSTGYELQNPKSNHPTYFGALGIHYRLSRNWNVSLRGEYFNALDTNPKKGYSKKSGWLSFTYSFGPEPTRPYQASQPQRPTGQ